jgi:hypothetical protein
MKMTLLRWLFFLSLSFLVNVQSVWSQPSNPNAPDSGGIPQEPSSDPDNPVPLTGLEYLLISGGVFGVHRMLKKAKNIENQ